MREDDIATDPMLRDPTMQAKWSRVHGQTLPPPLTPEQVWENDAAFRAEYGDIREKIPDPCEHLKARSEKVATCEAEKKSREVELKAAETMGFTFRTGYANRAYKQARRDAAIYIGPQSAERMDRMPSLRAAALAEMIEAVRSMPFGEVFPDERLAREADTFLLRMENPICGSGGHIPHHVSGGMVVGGRGEPLMQKLDAWADVPQQQFQQMRDAEQARMRQELLRQQAGLPPPPASGGFGAIAPVRRF